MNVTDAIQGNTTNSSQSSSIKQSDAMGKDEFLRLLTVQLEHQNPLDPMKGQEFSSQLAQFSQVEQLENINSGISSSNELDLQLTRSITNSLSTTMVGKEAKVNGNQVMVDQDDIPSVSFNLKDYADNVEIKLKNSQGKTVRTINKKGLEAGEHSIDIDKAGLDLENEKYTFSVNATNGENSVKAAPMMIGLVKSVRFNEQGSFVVLGNTEAPFSSVLEVGIPK